MKFYFYSVFVVTVIITSTSMLYCLTNALPVHARDIINYDSGFPWHLARLLNDNDALPYNPRYNAENRLVWPYHMDVTKQGQDTTIYILDTGVHPSHNTFRSSDPRKDGVSRVEDGKTFKNATKPATTDTDGHGTYAASVAAGITFGVATLANIIPYKLHDVSKSIAPTMNLLAAINTAKDNFKQENPKVGVINISVGTMPLREFRGEKVYKAITEAIQTGMHVVLAAGNDGKDLCGSNWVPGEWIYVGATDINDDIAAFSNYGECVDIYAPGDSIVVARHDDDMGTFLDSGTSYSAPLVSGVIASIGASDLNLARNPKLMKEHILNKAAQGIRKLPNGSHDRILQSTVQEKIVINI